MIKRWFFSIVFFFLVIPHAYALSCAAPPLTQENIDGAAAIFIGTPISKRDLGFTEKLRFKTTLRQKGGDPSNLKIYKLRVDRAWQGVERGTSAEVMVNTYWGDSFAMDVPLFVHIPVVVGGSMFYSPECGHTRQVKFAQDKIDAVNAHFAKEEKPLPGGYLPIAPADQKCVADDECTIITDHCSCSCGQPIAKAAIETYTERKQKICKNWQGPECKLLCKPRNTICRDNRCVFE